MTDLSRVSISPKVLTKASIIGLRGTASDSLSQQIKGMIKKSILKSPKRGRTCQPVPKEKQKGMRRYGSFKFVVRNHKIIDISVTKDDWCHECYGVGFFLAPDGVDIDCYSCNNH